MVPVSLKASEPGHPEVLTCKLSNREVLWNRKGGWESKEAKAVDEVRNVAFRRDVQT